MHYYDIICPRVDAHVKSSEKRTHQYCLFGNNTDWNMYQICSGMYSKLYINFSKIQNYTAVVLFEGV